MKKEEILEVAAKILRKSLEAAVPVIITGITCYITSNLEDRKYIDADYADTIEAISSSDMMSSYRKNSIAMVPKNADSSVYKAIIKVANSDMMSSGRYEAIKDICK